MTDFFINWTNFSWLLFLAAAYVASVRITAMDPVQIAKVKERFKHLTRYPLPIIVVGIWVVLRTLYALGWLLQVELFIILSVANFMHRQEKRRNEQLLTAMHDDLMRAARPEMLLGENLPQWVLFPGMHRVQWLNTVVEGMWSNVAMATENSLKTVLQTNLDKNKPGFVYEFSVRSCSIGPKPIVFTGLQHHAFGDKETTLDFGISWDGATDIRLLVKVPGPDVEVFIRSFIMRTTLRVTLGPHIPMWPCFGSIALSLVGEPKIDFDMVAGGISFDSVPGLGNFLDNFLRHTLVNMLAYPKRIIIPVVQGHLLESSRSASALGTLNLMVDHVEDWKPKYVSSHSKTPWYVKSSFVGEESNRARSASRVGLSEKLEENFRYTLYDSSRTIKFWLYFDVVGSDILVGECDVPTAQFLDGSVKELRAILVKPSDATHQKRAVLVIKVDYRSYSGKQEPPENSPPREASPEFMTTVTKREIIPLPLSRPSHRNSIATSVGTVFVVVHRCLNLKNKEKLGTSDPYVQLRIGKETAKSKYVNSNLNPVFDFHAELEIDNPETDVMRVSIIDKNDMNKDVLMGEVTIPIIDIQRSSGCSNKEFQLAPRGSVFITATVRTH